MISEIFAQLSKAERKISKHVDMHNAEAEKLLVEMININSGTMNFEGVKEVGKRMAEEFEKIGMETEWVDGSPFQRAGHFIARNNGKGKKVLMIGHLDTVFELESPFQEAEYLNDSTLRGPGVADMKGGNIIILQALKALKEAGHLDKLNVVVVMTGDEELSGRPLDLARAHLKEEASDSDFVLGFENGDGDPATALVSRRGASKWKIEVEGTPSHSSQIFSERVGAGAIYEASRIMNEFYNELAGEEYLTFNPGLFLGGTQVDHDDKMDSGYSSGKDNIVSKTVIITGDIRTISAEQYDQTVERMKEIVARHLPSTTAVITFDRGYPPLAPSEGNRDLLKLYSEASEDLGYGEVVAVDPMKAGAADVSFTSGLAPMIIDGLGLSGTHGHTETETGDLRFLPVQTKRAAILLYRLSLSR